MLHILAKNKKWYSLALSILLFITMILPTGFIVNVPKAQAAAPSKSNHVVISQVFIGNSTSIYKSRFVELYNPTNSPVDVSTWSLQNTSATGAFSTITKLTGSIPANGYYLIQCTAQSNTVGLDLQNPDVIASGSVNFGAAGAKLAIASKQTAISGSSDAAVVDFIGYGTATDSWGTVAIANPNVSTMSYFRLTNTGLQPDVSGDGNGWDSKNNKNDFVFESPNPRNSSYPVGPSTVDLGSTTINALQKVDANGLTTNLGKSATITGVVTAENKVLGTENTNFYIQDSSGGINVIGLNNPSITIAKGHNLQISGRVAFTKGQTRFIANSITDLGTATAPVPKTIQIMDLTSFSSAEPLEGNLTKFYGKVTAVTKLGSDYNVTVADASDKTAIVKVLGITGIDPSNELVLNSFYTFTGIVGQSQVTSPYTTGYYLMIRNISDIRGEVSVTHTPLAKGIPDVDLPFSAIVKNADTVTLYYKAVGDASYKSIAMNSADAVNYNGSIPAASVPIPTFVYYIEAKGDKTVSVGPYTVEVGADTEGPTFSNALPANGDTIETKHPEISVSMFDLSGVDALTAKITIGSKDFTNQAIKKEDQIRLNLTTADDLPEGPNTVTVEAKDKVGNKSTYSWTFTVAQRFTGGNHYRGTTHNHTNISHDASGSPEDALKASQNYNYDFFAFSDHSHDIDSSLVNKDTVDHKGMPERSGGSDWQLTKDLAKKYTQDGEFVVFPAFEMTSTTWGHSNVFGTTDFIDRMQDGGKYQNLQNYYAWVLTYDNIVAQFNHPAMSANAFDNFIPYDKKVDKLFTMLEVGNGSGHYGYANAEDKLFSALDLGWHVAPTYGEDNHDATWGQTKKRTVIVSKDLTQESLLDSMRKMRVYFSEDPNAQLDVSASGWYMGSITDTKTLQFDINVSDPVSENSSDPKYSYLKTASNDNIDKIEIVSNGGRVVDTISPSGSKTSLNWKPTVNVVGGQQWFVVRVTQKDGDRIYSAPIWSPTDDLYVKVSSVTASEGSITGAVPTTLTASISNLGVINVSNLNASFYYDTVDIGNKIGEAVISELQTNKSATAQVTWANPIAGNHKIIVVLTAGDGNNIGENKFEQAFTIKPPLGIKVLIDSTHQNENTSTDTGKYANNLTTFTSMMRKEGYTIAENTTAITSAALTGTKILMLTHPATSYSTTEINAIKDFITGGGSVFVSEKSNGTALNNLLSGVGSTVLFNGDTIYDDSRAGNFWATITGNEYAVRAHPVPLNNYLTDFVSVMDFYSGTSLARNNAGARAALVDTNNVSILVRGNEATFQQSAPSGGFSYKVGSGSSGGSQIPLVAAEQIGSGRLFIAGMNIFNDNQLKVSTDPNDNGDFALNAMKWLGHLDTKVTSIGDARKLAPDTEVVVQGKVTSGAGVFYDAVYVQDDTGGIMAFSEIPEGSLKVGDTIRAYGHIKIFENNFELEFDKFANSIVKISSGSPIQPKSLSTKNATLDENMGQLVKVFGQVTAIPDDSSYVLDDGSGGVLVFVDGYIASQSGVPIPKLKIGDKLSAIGLSGAFSEGTRIRVRDTRELIKTDALIPVTGVQLDKNSATVSPGDPDITLIASVLPANATIKTVIWSSSNEAIAKVNNGVVSIVGLGTATISAESLDGGFKASAVINVIPVKPNVRADIGAKVIVGIDSTMEYNIDGLGWNPYVASSPPNLSGEHNVQVRVKATGSVLAGQIKNLYFSTAAPALTGFAWTAGSTLGTKATAVPTGTLKYAVGAANALYQPAIGEIASDYTKPLVVNTDIFASPGQHIFIVSVDGSNKITGWADVSVASGNLVTPPTLVKWDFEDSTTNASSGLKKATAKPISVVGPTGAFSYPTTSGSKAVSTSGWDAAGDKYWLASFDASGYSYIQVTSKQTSSGTGPKEFKLQYSLDGTTWSNVPNAAITITTASTFVTLDNATLPPAANNQSALYVRWLLASNNAINAGATIATGGTSRLDDVIVTGIQLRPAPAVNADDTNKVITGIDSTMEYNINNSGWVAYNSATPPMLDGNFTVQVRVSAVGDVMPGLSKTLTFTGNAQAPAAPNVTADDVNNKIIGIDATMEYSIDGGAWTTYNAAGAPNLSGNHIVEVRVKANGAIPAGQSTVLTFTENTIAVTGVTLAPSTFALMVGDTQTLTTTVAPMNATNPAVTWKSNNPNVADVDDSGQVTAVGAGTATITVTTVDGGKTATSDVTVSSRLDAINPTLTGSNRVLVGGTIDLAYGLSNVTSNVYAQDITFTYDPTQVEFVSASAMNNEFEIVSQQVKPGQIRFIAAIVGAANVRNGDLMQLRWKVKPSITQDTTAIITLSNLVLTEGDFGETKVAGVSHSVQISAIIDKAVLNALIADAQTKLAAAEEGTKVGQYPAGTKDALLTAINSAQAVSDNQSAAQSVIDQAVAALNSALLTFTSSINIAEPGDLNGDGRISIADLGIAARYYGKTSADPNWNTYKKADINNDGKVDIQDLAIIARKIVSSK
ncbi:DUF4073 domain-containing protein [Paenibacillus planticolens]|uniref:DUF4073 domain-containing protein n=1 Tax=Paenibacillus planticolens TaxID=2654976 RepID=A0ABX1ZMH6_9BACL|nr:DUF4073 domain-containing protein [Paenibacillus planticolens]NOU99819.1 DUF4073 domain-containing protein [Paenibacillus planticolens]